MKYCDKCKVSIVGDRKFCPLCQGLVTDLNNDNSEVFPVIPTIYKQYNLFFRLLIFFSVVVGVVAVLVNYALVPQTGFWSFFVLVGIACFWLNIAFAVRKRTNILKNVMYQFVTISITTVFWDIITGWHKWSIEYVFPILLSVSIFAMIIIAVVMKQYIEDQIIYFCIDSAFGLIPLILLFTKQLRVVLPSVISIAVCVITVTALLVFQGDILKNELKKRLHV